LAACSTSRRTTALPWGCFDCMTAPVNGFHAFRQSAQSALPGKPDHARASLRRGVFLQDNRLADPCRAGPFGKTGELARLSP
jgi:hypothetical protein